MNDIILRFEGQHDFLSNLYHSDVVFEGLTYPTLENAFQASKTLKTEERLLFTACTPTYARQLGSRVSLRGDWDDVKLGIMRELLHQKFKRGTFLAEDLLATGDSYICAGNTWHDNYFGACLCDYCCFATHHNVLGNMLMELRQELRMP